MSSRKVEAEEARREPGIQSRSISGSIGSNYLQQMCTIPTTFPPPTLLHYGYSASDKVTLTELLLYEH